MGIWWASITFAFFRLAFSWLDKCMQKINNKMTLLWLQYKNTKKHVSSTRMSWSDTQISSTTTPQLLLSNKSPWLFLCVSYVCLGDCHISIFFSHSHFPFFPNSFFRMYCSNVRIITPTCSSTQAFVFTVLFSPPVSSAGFWWRLCETRC